MDFLKIIIIIINLFFASQKIDFFPKSLVFKLAKNRIYSKGRRLTRRRKLPSPPPPLSQPSLQQKQKKIQLMCKAISKKKMNMFKTQPALLVFRWLLEVDPRSSRKSHESFREKENNLKTTKA